MANQIAGPGQGLPIPQALRPPQMWTTPFTPPTNHVMLQGGQSLIIPAGTWIVHSSGATPYTIVEWKDPVTRTWVGLPPIGTPWGQIVRSDGFNFRIANLSGVPWLAVVTSGGSGYNSATTTVVPSVGDSKWRAIIGGAIGAVTIIKPGKNYSIPPQVFIPAPPAPGVCAFGHSVLTNGEVTGIVIDNPGAGYLGPIPPPIWISPDPLDPVLLAAADVDDRMTTSDVIQDAQASCVLTGEGTVTAVLLVSAGVPVTSVPTLTISGQGTGAAATVVSGNAQIPFSPSTEEFVYIQAASGP